MTNRSDNKESANLSSRWPRAWVFLSLVIVALVGIVAYSNSFAVPFTFDDEEAIATNDVIKEVSRIFAGQGLHYNPRRVVGYLSLALNYRYGGLDVAGYHVVNLTIHVASAFLVFALTALTLKTPFFAETPPSEECRPLPEGAELLPLMVALLFVAHPIQTQAVTYTVQRFASLATLFYLAAVVCYARGRVASAAARSTSAEGINGAPAEGWRRGAVPLCFVLAALMSGLAMLTKEIAATLPAAIVLYECSFFGGARKKLVGVFVVAVALAGACGLFLLATHRGADFIAAMDAMTRETPDISRASYFLTQITVIVRYLGLLILPLSQQVVYDYPLRHSPWDLDVFLSSLLLGSLLALSGWSYLLSGRACPGMPAPLPPAATGRRLLRITGFGVAWFFLTLSVESGIIPIRDVIFEHRLYLPSTGVFLAVVAAAVSFLGARHLRILAGVAGVLVVTLAASTYLRNETWRDPVRFWRDNAVKAPLNADAWLNLGVALHRKRDFEGAIEAYKCCLALNEMDARIYNNLGAANASIGRLADASEMFGKSLRLQPAQWSAWLNLGSLDVMRGDYAAAESEMQTAIRLAPERMEGHFHLGDLYQRTGRYREAEDKYRKALALDPAYSLAWKGLGNVCRARGLTGEAAEYMNRGVALEQMGGDVYYGVSGRR
ncbi:MAG: hypothetical protein A2075_19240 [Geobacteraceae bacterium GWC2_58_44]|nr:MAG: hypothetical protein A2075_19240 [Geobacteraceae bacterium GWC2_58_44]